MVACHRNSLLKFMCLEARIFLHTSIQSENIKRREMEFNSHFTDYFFHPSILPTCTRIHRLPFFEFKSLEPGMGYDILVMAVNKKGKSGPVLLQAYTLKNPEKQTGEFYFSCSISQCRCLLSMILTNIIFLLPFVFFF